MEITRKSLVSGLIHTLDLPITTEQLAKFQGGELIQNAFPHLSDTQREFILTGITQEEWEKTFPPDEDEDTDPDDEAAF